MHEGVISGQELFGDLDFLNVATAGPVGADHSADAVLRSGEIRLLAYARLHRGRLGLELASGPVEAVASRRVATRLATRRDQPLTSNPPA